MNPIVAVPAALFGLAAGSFLNVVIYRLPLRKSVVKPRSFCPVCRRPIRWHENLPVLSYIILRGKCSACGAGIPARYPAVEILGGALALLAVHVYGVTVDAVFAYAFLMALTAVMFIDWGYRIIPDAISLSFILAGLVWSAFNPSLSMFGSASGALAGGGGLWLVGAVYRAVRHAEGMGGGDVKLMAMIGSFVGIELVLPVIIIASFFGSIYGIFLLRSGERGKTAVAFGSFLAPAAGICLIFGSRILAWYFSLM